MNARQTPCTCIHVTITHCELIIPYSLQVLPVACGCMRVASKLAPCNKYVHIHAMAIVNITAVKNLIDYSDTAEGTDYSVTNNLKALSVMRFHFGVDMYNYCSMDVEPAWCSL